jgi:hypothetical protein
MEITMAAFVGTKGDHRKPSSIGRTMKGKGNIKPPVYVEKSDTAEAAKMRRMMGGPMGPITG